MAGNVEQIISSIRRLPPPDREKLLQLLAEERSSNVLAVDHLSREVRSKLSLQWLNANRSGFLGKWVSLDGDRLVASGMNAREVYDLAKAQGIKTPFVEFISVEDSTPFTGGWL